MRLDGASEPEDRSEGVSELDSYKDASRMMIISYRVWIIRMLVRFSIKLCKTARRLAYSKRSGSSQAPFEDLNSILHLSEYQHLADSRSLIALGRDKSENRSISGDIGNADFISTRFWLMEAVPNRKIEVWILSCSLKPPGKRSGPRRSDRQQGIIPRG